MTAPTFAQVQKLLSQLDNWDREAIQTLLESGLLGLIEEVGVGRLRGLDLSRLRSVLTSIPQAVQWRQITSYWKSFEEWNRRFNLDIPGPVIADIGTKLKHVGPYAPATVCYYSGRGLATDWTIAMDVLQYELQKCHIDLNIGVSPLDVSYRDGCGTWAAHPQLSPAGTVDLVKYWKPETNSTVKDILEKQRTWPALEIVWLLALNPHVISAMSGGNFPDLYLSGLEVPTVGIPFIGCYNRTAFISCTQATEIAKNIAVVA